MLITGLKSLHIAKWLVRKLSKKMIKWIKNLKYKQNIVSEKEKTRLEQMKKNPYKRVDSENMTDIEKMDQGFNGKTFTINSIEIDF